MSKTTVPARPPCRLYLITPPAVPDLTAFAGQLAQALESGDVAALQIRLKDVPDAEVRRAVEVLAPLAQARDVAVILNDRADLAKVTGCDGVHLGQRDGPVAVVDEDEEKEEAEPARVLPPRQPAYPSIHIGRRFRRPPRPPPKG